MRFEGWLNRYLTVLFNAFKLRILKLDAELLTNVNFITFYDSNSAVNVFIRIYGE